MNPRYTNVIVNEIIDSMTVSILTELVSTYTELDSMEIGLDSKSLVHALRAEKVDFHGDVKEAIEEVWDDAYDNVVHGNEEYWDEEYGLYGEEVESVILNKEDKIIKKVLSLLK